MRTWISFISNGRIIFKNPSDVIGHFKEDTGRLAATDGAEYHNAPQIMATLRLACQGRPAVHALEAGGLLCLLAPGVPALHVFDLDVQVQALGAPLLSLPEGAVGLCVLPLTAARGKVMVGFPQPVMEQVSLSMSMFGSVLDI